MFIWVKFPIILLFLVASFFLAVWGIVTPCESVITFTQDFFTHYEETTILSHVYRQLVDQVAVSSIQDVLHHNLKFQEGKSTTTSRVVAIQTQDQDFFWGKGASLSRDECAWLVQEIKRWLDHDL